MQNGQFHIVAMPFGYPMYASPNGIGWTDNKSEAYTYDDRNGDNPDIKYKYWCACLANSGIDTDTIRIEYTTA